MKPGIQIGDSISMAITVTSDMFAKFDGVLVHPAYSTVSMVYHMEWVSRQIILPYLEDHEEGMGSAVSVKHIAPSIEGANLMITATVTAYESNFVLTRTDVKHGSKLVGLGEVKQVILPKVKINELLQTTK
ncbi:thioesterase family protein [Bacillus salitolerans]|uniref:Thioesterase family protein n=1 Tax=Bacillus salitolerans TaxID=1437434 RepID=A0ABW4LQ75_9BACI